MEKNKSSQIPSLDSLRYPGRAALLLLRQLRDHFLWRSKLLTNRHWFLPPFMCINTWMLLWNVETFLGQCCHLVVTCGHAVLTQLCSNKTLGRLDPDSFYISRCIRLYLNWCLQVKGSWLSELPRDVFGRLIKWNGWLLWVFVIKTSVIRCMKLQSLQWEVRFGCNCSAQCFRFYFILYIIYGGGVKIANHFLLNEHFSFQNRFSSSSAANENNNWESWADLSTGLAARPVNQPEPAHDWLFCLKPLPSSSICQGENGGIFSSFSREVLKSDTWKSLSSYLKVNTAYLYL